MPVVPCDSIADIGASYVGNYVWLPVLCLSLQTFSTRLGRANCGVLLVTDFSDNARSALSVGIAPHLVPQNPRVGRTLLAADKVFPISVSMLKFAGVMSRVADYTRSVNVRQLGSLASDDGFFLDLSQAGVVACLNFKVQSFVKDTPDGAREGLEGFFANMELCTRDSLRSAAGRKFQARQSPLDTAALQPFMRRFLAYLDPPLYDMLLRNGFPVERYVSRLEVQRATGPLAQSTQALQPQAKPQATQATPQTTLHTEPTQMHTATPQKRPATQTLRQPKLLATDLAFRQQETQPGAARAFSEQVHFSELDSDIPESSDTLDTSEDEDSTPQSWNPREVHYVDFAVLKKIQLHTVEDSTEFETICTVSAVLPAPEDVFVRPFGRTLKFQSFKLILGDHCCAEILLQQEACTFFSILEVEQAITRLAELGAALRSLVGKKVSIRLQKRKLPLQFAYTKPYWSCSSTLADLCL